MVLQLQEEIALAEAVFVLSRNLLRLVDQPFLDIALYFTGQTRRQRDNPLMKLLQHFHIHTGSVIVSFRKPTADNLHQIGIARIILCQQHQMIISVLAAGQFPVKPGMRRHVNFTADDRIDPRRRGFLIEVNDAIHNAVIRDGGAVHPQFFDTFDIFFDFIGTVQQTVFGVDV